MNHQKSKRMKLLSLLLALTMTLSLGLFQNTALAEIITINDLQYELSNFKMAAEVFGLEDKNISHIAIPDKIEYNGKSYTVTSIKSSNSHHNNEHIAEITLPNGIKWIGEHTFSQYTNLSKITLPDSIISIGKDAFWGCSKLKEITIPNGIRVIRDNTFINCTSLTKLSLPNSVTEIRTKAFAYCSKLEEITIPNGVNRIEDKAFYGCYALTKVKLPESITEIKSKTFGYCSELTEITIPKSVKKIEDNFGDCRKLKDIYYNGTQAEWNNIEIGDFGNDDLRKATVHFSDGTTIPGNPAYSSQETVIIDDFEYRLNNTKMTAEFFKCKNKAITNAVIPDTIKPNGQTYTVTSIGGDFMGIFEDCENLIKVTLPNSIKTIRENAFYNCRKLEEVNIPNGLKTIGNEAFSACKSLTKLMLPNSVVAIGRAAFWGCDKLEEINIPDGISTIESQTFSDCFSLSKLTLPDSVISIGNRAFFGCNKLKEISIPNGVSVIEDKIFSWCNLDKLVLPDSIVLIGNEAFSCSLSLKELTLPKSVKKIEKDAFIQSYNFRDIYYDGVKADWDNIEIADFNDHLGYTTVHLADGTTIPGVTPGNPSNPGTATPPSVTPPVPGTPGTPGNPGSPSNPSTPGNPSNPGTATPPSVTPYVPSEPSTPSTPNTPNKPSTPSTPNKPADKNNPTEPGKENAAPKSITLTEVKTALTEKLTKSESLAPTVFADTEQHWAKESIQFMNKLGILNGIKETEFAPNEAMTRAMFITALGRLGNVKEQDYSASSFGDVPADAYYRSFAEWAKTAGISSGTQMGSFAPNQPISREQIATMIFRFAKYLGYELPAVQAKAAFADEAQISSWAKEAVIALQQAGILQGKGNQMFDPQGKATRAEIAALLQRLVQAIMK